MTDNEQLDARAIALAEAWWPGRYVGDLTTAEWRRVYATLDHQTLEFGDDDPAS